jgi:hypothetical protein
VVLPRKGMLERTTSVEAECSVLRIRECGDIIPQKIRDKGGLTVFCLTFDDVVGMDDATVRQTAGILRSHSVSFNTAPVSKPTIGVAAARKQEARAPSLARRSPQSPLSQAQQAPARAR